MTAIASRSRFCSSLAEWDHVREHVFATYQRVCNTNWPWPGYFRSLCFKIAQWDVIDGTVKIQGHEENGKNRGLISIPIATLYCGRAEVKSDCCSYEYQCQTWRCPQWLLRSEILTDAWISIDVQQRMTHLPFTSLKLLRSVWDAIRQPWNYKRTLDLIIIYNPITQTHYY